MDGIIRFFFVFLPITYYLIIYIIELMQIINNLLILYYNMFSIKLVYHVIYFKEAHLQFFITWIEQEKSKIYLITCSQVISYIRLNHLHF